MVLSQQIDEDLKGAMKGRDELKVSALRMLKAAASNAAIQKGKPALEDGEMLEVIGKLIKQRQESVEAFTQGNRPELAEREAQEAKILKEYLPPSMEEGELKALIQATIKELGANGPSALGTVMKAVLPKVRGRADGKQVSQIAVQLLQVTG